MYREPRQQIEEFPLDDFNDEDFPPVPQQPPQYTRPAIVLRDEDAAILQEQIDRLLRLWDLEPFYFRQISQNYYRTFAMCKNAPPASIEFDAQDLKNYQRWLEEIVKNNSSNYNYRTHLTCVAAQLNLSDLMEVFIRLKAPLNLPDPEGNTPFSLAVQANHREIMLSLYKAEAHAGDIPVDIRPTSPHTFLHPMVLKQKILALDSFIKKYPPLFNTLDLCTKFRLDDLVKTIRFNGSISESKQYYAQIMQSLVKTPDPLALRYAIFQGDPDFLRELLMFHPNAVRNFRADPNKSNLIEYTMQVAQNSQEQYHRYRSERYDRIMQILVNHGAEFTQADTSTSTPIIRSSFIEPPKTVARSSGSSLVQNIRNLWLDF